MGCCQATPPSPQQQKSAFSDFTKTRDHHGGDSNYTLSSVGKHEAQRSTKYYESRNIKSSPGGSEEDDHGDTTELQHLNKHSNTSSPSSSSSISNDSTKGLIKNKKNNQKNNTNTNTNDDNKQNKPSSNPLPYKTTLSPMDATIITATNNNHSDNDNDNHNDHDDDKKNNNKDINIANNNNMEREVSISKSKSRQFRHRNEPNSPSQKSKNNMNEPPPISDDDDDDDDEDDDDNIADINDSGSDASSDEEIPGLKEIIFSDNPDDEGDDVNDPEHDENLKLMALLVQNENERLEKEIIRIKSYVEEQEDNKLKQEAFQEIEDEAKENKTNDAEEEKRKKALARYEKKQKQRMKEKEEAKERRRIKKEEKKKKQKALLLKKKMAKRQKERLKKRDELREKRKKEIEEYSAPEERPTRKQIVNMFDKYFYKPFQQQIKSKQQQQKHKKQKHSMSDDDDSDSTDSDDDSDDDLGEGGINFNGFKAGLKALGIDKVLTKSEIEQLFDHIAASNTEDGISAVDFCHFLKQNAITLEPKIAIIQRKVIATLAKQQEKEDQEQEKQNENEEIINPSNSNNNDDNNNIDNDNDKDKENDNDDTKPDDIDDIGDMPPITIQIYEPEISDKEEIKEKEEIDSDHDEDDDEDDDDHKIPDIITPIENIENEQDAEDEDDEDDEDDLVMNLPESQPESRRNSVSISESMSMSVSVLPSNIPRKSFKQINYNWNESISKKSFNNYKRLRQKFAFRYQHTPRKTKDQELAKLHEKIFTEAINKDLNEDLNGNLNETLNEDLNEEPQHTDNDDDNHKIEEKQDEKQDNIKKDTEQQPPQQMDDNNNNNTENEEKQKHRILLTDIDENEETNAISLDFRQRSAAKSLQKINEYQGNEEMVNLRKLYKEQHKMKQKLERLRKRSLLSFPAPPKPKDIEIFMDDKTLYTEKEVKLCICKNTRYTGLANFGPNGELGIEIEFTSDYDSNGYIEGKRVIHFKGMKQAMGRGRVWKDLSWNGHKYLPCTKFEWIDEGEGVTTKLEFDTKKHEIDVDHSFFQGKCIRYPSDLDPKRRSTKLIMHEGFFDFVCVSARRRAIRRNSLLQYHTLDINEMSENELEKVPKYVRRMSAYTEKIDQLYEQDAPITKETLFGDAISTVAAINENDPITSDTSLPEQINE